MADQFTFQAIILPNASSEDVMKRIMHVETLGLDFVGIADHFVDWNNAEIPWLECWTLLGAVAQATSRIKLGPLVSQFPLRNPAMFARQALTVDHLSGGRLVLGLGTGLTIDPAYEMTGIPNYEPKERVARFKEYVEVVDQLLTNETTSYEGQYYQIKGAVMNPHTPQKPRPPIMIGAVGPVMMKFAAEKADIWNTLSFGATFDEQLDEMTLRVQRVDQYCASIDRDPATLKKSYLMYDASSRASGGRITYYESSDAFTAQIEKLAALGITEFGLYYPLVDDQMEMFERIAQEVIPELKSAYRKA